MSLPRALLVNLPHRLAVQRRWIASYFAPNFLIPPVELMGLAALLTAHRAAEVRLVDAVAEGLSTRRVVDRYREFAPSLVIALIGFGTAEDDLGVLARLRAGLPGCRTVAFGHLPTERPAAFLGAGGADYVLRGEPEETLLDLLSAAGTTSGPSLAAVAGLAFRREDGSIHLGSRRARITNLDALPPPDHGLVDLSRYNESFVPRPIGCVTTARGCPFDCSFCVRAYGRRLVLRSVDSLLCEIAGLRSRGIGNIRFLDDTFTVDHERTHELCRRMRDEKLGVRWTALTRLDRLDAGLCLDMAAAGCRRLYVGVESARPERLAEWHKRLDLTKVEAGARAARSAGIELSGFFIVGAPGETDEEAKAGAYHAVRLGLDFVIVTRLQRWPGTTLGEEPTDDAGTLPSPSGAEHEAAFARERAFYRRFYARPRWVLGHAHLARSYPWDVARGLVSMARYAATPRPARDFI